MAKTLTLAYITVTKALIQLLTYNYYHITGTKYIIYTYHIVKKKKKCSNYINKALLIMIIIIIIKINSRTCSISQ